MKLVVARILIILFVNKPSAYGVPILESIDLAAENVKSSSADGTQTFAAQTPATETLPEFISQKKVMENDKDSFLKNLSQLKELPKHIQNRNLTEEDTKDVNDFDDMLEIEKSAAARLSTVSEEVDLNFLAVQENDYRNAAIQPEGARNDSNRQDKHKKLLAESGDSFVVPEILNVASETQSDKTGKYVITSLSTSSTKNGGQYNHSRAGNKYRIATKPLNSNDIIQSLNSAESELIEIILKEASNLVKQPEENNKNLELASSESNLKSVLAKEASKEETNLTLETNENATILLRSSDSNSTSKLVSIPVTNFEEFPNYTNASNQQEEKAESPKEAWMEITTPGAGCDIILKSHIPNVTDELEIEGIIIMNKTQEETTSRVIWLLDGDELTLTTSRPQIFAESENELLGLAKEIKNLNRTQETYLIDKKFPVIALELSQTSLNSSKRHKNSNETENKLEAVDLKEHSSLNKEQEEHYPSSLEPLALRNTTLFAANKLTPKENPAETENGLKAAILQVAASMNKTSNENELNPNQKFAAFDATMLIPKTLKSIKLTQHSNVTDDELMKDALEGNLMAAAEQMTAKTLDSNQEPQYFTNPEKELEKVTMSSDKLTDLSSTEPTVELTTYTSTNKELKLDSLNEFEEPENYRTTEGNNAVFENQQLAENKQFSAELSTFTLGENEEEDGEEEEEQVTTSRSLISLEEYAVKQMNFILDHLLLETQKFVAIVLQATINSVFPRDRLKHYAEGVNQVLNPAIESEYSDEILETTKSDDQDEIYEQIVEKLNFFKTRSSKYLQKQIPPEWLNEFLAKRAELAIWLDKAAEQMHKEFTAYITQDADPIKYQYFNETFDDISRATEIHHKLALLADLVKIIKNKKQITFMDLYMQN